MRFGRSHNFLRASVYIAIFIVGYVGAQDYFEEHHKYQVRTPSKHLKEIPKHFEVKGENAIPTFNKYLSDIQNLASKKNISIVYKVRVEVLNKNKHKNTKHRSNNKTKKFNIPLKKKNMKLSNFEIIMRKRASEFGAKQHMEEMSTATERRKVMYTTRQSSAGKYKPEVGVVKTKYAKIIRPVKNTEFALKS